MLLAHRVKNTEQPVFASRRFPAAAATCPYVMTHPAGNGLDDLDDTFCKWVHGGLFSAPMHLYIYPLISVRGCVTPAEKRSRRINNS